MRNGLTPRDAVQRMAPYSPPTSGRRDKLRLDFNENTVGCSPKVAEFLRAHISQGMLSVYPEYTDAKRDLAAHFGVAETEMLLTNGTDEAIQLLMHTFVDGGTEVIILQPSYAMYKFYAELSGACILQISYRQASLEFPLEELLDAITPSTSAILISNPNNPTGTAASVNAIERILEAAPDAVVLVDEAYHEFCGITALPLIGGHPNLFVSRTFSKAYGMAAMRIGCLFSNAANAEAVRKTQSPYSVNMLAALAARVAVSDREYIGRYVSEVVAARESFCDALRHIGVPFYKSAGNFVLVRLGARAAEIRDALGAAGILVRDRSYELPGCVRATIGTREQTRRVADELERLWR